jgi:16S rRNA (cytidine1402-2'-O)-methyltransferase
MCGAERKAVVARELTKLHEEVICGTLSELVGYYQAHSPRGEITVLVEGAADVRTTPDPAQARARAEELLAAGNTRKDVAGLVAKEFALPKRDAYKMVCEL